MICRLVELPYANINSCEFDTRIDFNEEAPTTLSRGRIVDLGMFNNNSIYKYKIVEQAGLCYYERLFLSIVNFASDTISSDDMIYPLQIKIIPMDNVAEGKTYKYVDGIMNFLTDSGSCDSDKFLGISGRSMVQGQVSPYINEKIETIIPSPDFYITTIDMYQNFLKPYDNWLNTITPISKEFSIYLREHFVEKFNSVIDSKEALIDPDPIAGDFRTYFLIEFLNSLSVSDIVIKVTRDGVFIADVKSDYSSKQVQLPAEVSGSICSIVENFIHYKIGLADWDLICITKSSSEEIVIECYNYLNGQYILSQPIMYIDIPLFILGTIGLI